MAVFTIAKTKDNEYLKYINAQDLENLVHYCCDKSVYIGWNHLYPLGIDGFINQMLYLQNFRGKPLSTRAIHYILSVEYCELPKKEPIEQMKKVISYLAVYFFDKYQCIYCLHKDKKNKYDIHIIINPVNIYTYNLYHCSMNDFKALLRGLTIGLYAEFQLVLDNVGYVDYDGRLKMDV